MAPQHLRPRFRFTIYGQYKNFLSNCLGLVCFPTCHSLLDYKKGAHSFVFYSFVIGGHLYLYWISYLLIQPPWHKGQCCIVRKFIHVHVQLSLGLSLETVYGTTCCSSLARLRYIVPISSLEAEADTFKNLSARSREQGQTELSLPNVWGAQN